ncbi:hypothetical protein SOV_01480 [Sporomusa ovata DSM 2662]|uniref:Conserved protein n=1 Tax=Sporomusa ovata TaxID=2378 RepID=A0A0U1KZQ7_9FIRM|nr:DUF2225 domain-containing protein [Sporomusa ovata]EQB27832.1 hypothetical protein SOV_2c07410 [Sporomusa ovata DSM 2662]CQR72765.1 Conserved protein [Sporomusa ovata]
MTEPTYSVEKECPVCQQKFNVTRTRGRQILVKQDSDFCSYFRDINPYYYTIWVCPHCGYAATDSYFAELSVAAKDKIAKFLASRAVNVNYSGNRTREQAIATYKLAIFFAELITAPASKLADLYLKLSWLYREGEDEEDEKSALAIACEQYEQALSRERLPIGTLSEAAVSYLIGELARRTDQIEKALLYLGKVVGNPAAKLEPRVFKLTRDAWHAARATRDGKKVPAEAVAD